jgi:hypothetical protein
LSALLSGRTENLSGYRLLGERLRNFSTCNAGYHWLAMYNDVMAKHVIHNSDAEAASDFASLLDRVREGAAVRPADPHVRLPSESLRLAKEHGSTATLDGDFARDLEEVINSHREPLNPPAWD